MRCGQVTCASTSQTIMEWFGLKAVELPSPSWPAELVPAFLLAAPTDAAPTGAVCTWQLCHEVLPAACWEAEKRAQTKYLHRIIVFMIFSFYCRKGVQFRINTSDCWRCSLIRMNQVHVFLALVQSVFTNKSSLLKRPFSENPIQSSGNCYCPQVQGKFRAILRKAVINLSTSGFFPFSLLLNHEIM